VVFIGVGFETTSPAIAATILEARKRNLRNFYVLPAFKLIPPALRFIAGSPRINVTGLILPGHVSVIIGARPYEFLARDFQIPGCITGFEPVDILLGIEKLVTRIHEGRPAIDMEYGRAVKPEGNKRAMDILFSVFEPCDSKWRGIGMIPGSGLSLKRGFERFDASAKYDHIKLPTPVEPKGCICGKVLLGLRSPLQCKLFGKKCTPSTPVGACMVSSEGSCAAYYRYGGKRS
jgi:hydrogenase expression/formation protein HypD